MNDVEAFIGGDNRNDDITVIGVDIPGITRKDS